jgi:hypothetical protein
MLLNEMDKEKNPAAVALGKLAASRRTRKELAEAGRQGGLAKAKNRRFVSQHHGLFHPKSVVNARKAKRKTAAALEPDTELAESPTSNSKLFRDGVDQRNHERNLRLQEKQLKKHSKITY